MVRILGGIGLAVTLAGLGWALGSAQSRQPDFEFVVDAPVGETTVTCVRGCELKWVERGITNATPEPTFTFACGGGVAARCSSSRIGGWVRSTPR